MNMNSIRTKVSRVGTKSCIPDFTEEEIKLQKKKGLELMATLQKEAADLNKSSFTIPKGDYGFDLDKVDRAMIYMDYGFALRDIHRPEDNPFTIIAEDVTFWIQPTGRPFPASTVAFIIYNCENINVVGLTIDEYIPNDVEGIVKELDAENNRILIKLTNSSMPVTKENIADVSKCRAQFYKPNGNFINSLYKINPNIWGPGTTGIDKCEPTENKDEYYLHFKSDLPIKTAIAKEWHDVYGDEQTLQIGDFLALVYGNINIHLEHSKKISMIGLTCHISKCMPVEGGGYGAHLWKDCYFGPKPGTTKVLNGCEGMFCFTRHGTTIDHTTIISSSDDHINIHGMWSRITAVNGRHAEMKNVAFGCEKGDTVKFYDTEGNYLSSSTLAEVPEGGNVVLTDEIPASYTGMWARFPNMECDGWVIRNCTLESNYQRYLLQCGNGTFENNKVYNLGETFAVVNELGEVYVEGGLLKDVTFRNNVIYNCANCPGARVFKFAQNKQWKRKLMAGKMDVSDNLIVNSGMLAEGDNIETISFRNNIIIEPTTYNNDITKVSDLYGDMVNVDRFESADNDLYSYKCEEGLDGLDRTHKIDVSLTKKIKFLLDNTDKQASDIIEIVKNEL